MHMVPIYASVLLSEWCQDDFPMIRSIVATVPMHTVWVARQTILIRPVLPLLVRTCHALLPDLLTPHHILTA